MSVTPRKRHWFPSAPQASVSMKERRQRVVLTLEKLEFVGILEGRKKKLANLFSLFVKLASRREKNS